MNEPLRKRGEIVQIDPESDETFGGCFMVVTEPKSWGAQGYVDIPGKGRAYYRVNNENCQLVGYAEWMEPDDAD